MVKKTTSVLVIGFNTRPLAYSLNKFGYDVYAVDFFGDLDLYPNVRDCIIVTKKLGTNYNLIKDKYSKFLADFTIEMLKNYPDINYLIIGSGLDDDFESRKLILNEIYKKGYSIKNLNNNLEIIKKARNLKYLYKILKSRGYKVPLTYSYDIVKSKNIKFKFPFILKKKTGSGGINVFKIENEEKLTFIINILKANGFNPPNWLIQEYIEGIPVSCTTISNGNECEIISINRQIIGEKFLNSPKDFMYCGNVVPANLLKNEEKIISEISVSLINELGLKGINGLDFVLKNHYPYLMEINPRIPGSIKVSESVLDLNLLDLHIQSFDPTKWEYIKSLIKSIKPKGFATKLIIFAPKEIDVNLLNQINILEYIHDKTESIKKVLKGEPLCTILFKGKSYSESYFDALKIVDKIKEIIG